MRSALADPARRFERGPRVLTRRGTADDGTHTFTAQGGSHLSARRAGDARLFARRRLALLGPGASS